MRCTWKVLAVCLLLQSVYAYLPLNNESLIPKGAEILKENAEKLFEALFQPSQRKESFPDDRITQNELRKICGDLYAKQVEDTLYISGFGIRKCMRVDIYLLEAYMKFHDVEQIQQQFLEGIEQCSLRNPTNAEIKCYSRLISKLFNELNYLSSDLPQKEENCIDIKLWQMIRELAKVSYKYERCLSISSSNNNTSPPPQWNSTWAPPNATWAPPNSTWTSPNTNWTPPQLNSTIAPPNSTWAPPQWNSTIAPPNSTWAPPQWNSTIALPNSTWAPPQWNSTIAPPNSTWAPPQLNSTWAPPNSTWAPPNSTWTSPNTTWTLPQLNSTIAPPNSTWAPPQWNTTVVGNTTQVSINATAESNDDTANLPWYYPLDATGSQLTTQSE
ncbi:mucin-2-like [Bactrocera neohumeralis]|uniref:mucin-2-like n=1 Tax=Bactrocera neohumeralis TaxID=98809 RepID=UPI00216635AA|nr:mucin-2-like [Bactrocera neohumeralis]